MAYGLPATPADAGLPAEARVTESLESVPGVAVDEAAELGAVKGDQGAVGLGLVVGGRSTSVAAVMVSSPSPS